MTRHSILAVILFSVCLASGHAAADPNPEAQALFREGRALVASGKYEAACAKFEESMKIAPGSGTLFNLADCYEQLGRTASAWSGFLQVADEEKARGRAAREAMARKRATALEPKLSPLVVFVPKEVQVPGLEVRLDGKPVANEDWDRAAPIDPGEHVIEAVVPNTDRKWSSTVTVSGTSLTSVTVPPFPDDTPRDTPAPVAAPTSRATVQPAMDPSSANPGSSQRTLAYVAGGVGVVGVGASVFFGLKTRSLLADSNEYCDGNACWDARGVTARDDARRNGDIATLAGGIGAAALVTGAILYLTAPSSEPNTSVAIGPSGVSLQGVW